MPISDFIKNMGTVMNIERAGHSISSEQGLPNHESSTHKAYIGFLAGTDIQAGDIIVNPSNERMYVTNVETFYVRGEAQELKAYYLPEHEANQSSASNSVIYNISNVYGSIIGNGNTTTVNFQGNIDSMRKQAEKEDGPDKEQIQHLIDLVEMIVKEQVPVRKGLLSKFSNLMENHSWLSSSITATLFHG